MKSIFYLSFILVFQMLSCSQTTEKNHKQITKIFINTDDYSDCGGWNDLIKDIDFVPLETNDSSMIDRISSICFTANGNFLLKTKKRKILVFAKNGKLIYNFSKIGKGVNEIPYVNDAHVTSDNKLYIFGVEQKYLVVDNNYKNIQEKYFTIQNLYSDTYSPSDWIVGKDNNFYLWYTSSAFIPKNERYSLIITDSIGNIRSRNFPYNHYAGGGEHFFQSDSITLIQPPFLNDTIFQISDKKVFPSFVIDFVKHKYKPNDYKTDIPENMNNPFHLLKYCSQNNICYSISRPLRSDNYLIFNYTFSKELITCIYNISNEETILLNCLESKITNVFTPGLLYASYKNKFISVIDAWKVCQLLDEGGTACTFLNEKRRHELLNKLKDIKETDNPVLMILTLKDPKK